MRSRAPAGRIARLLPYGMVAAAAYVPLAAGLCVLTSTTWAVADAILWRGGVTT